MLAGWRSASARDGRLTHYHAPGCDARATARGYRGRAAHARADDGRRATLRHLIQTGARAERAAAPRRWREGMRTLRQDGIEKVLAGVTTIEEVRRELLIFRTPGGAGISWRDGTDGLGPRRSARQPSAPRAGARGCARVIGPAALTLVEQAPSGHACSVRRGLVALHRCEHSMRRVGGTSSVLLIVAADFTAVPVSAGGGGCAAYRRFVAPAGTGSPREEHDTHELGRHLVHRVARRGPGGLRRWVGATRTSADLEHGAGRLRELRAGQQRRHPQPDVEVAHHRHARSGDR
ncbi:MAG: hypothetical protein MZW92_57905 [Comamonadaceae bacterium]|nr:hypothetical protein [Comamonadaceae bacterium]